MTAHGDKALTFVTAVITAAERVRRKRRHELNSAFVNHERHTTNFELVGFQCHGCKKQNLLHPTIPIGALETGQCRITCGHCGDITRFMYIQV